MLQYIEGQVEITAGSRPYTPRGGARELMAARDKAILFDGPAGTGKTRAVLEKLHVAAEKYDGCRILAIRQTRVSMTESVLVTYENKVLPEGHPCLSGASRPQRSAYVYPNGSTIVVGGLDNADRIMSTEFDMVAVFEATETHEEDVLKLVTRLRNGVMPYQQLICDCNPAGPKHWLKRRADDGLMRRIVSRHQDNPAVTPEYMATLASMEGALRARLFEGRWVAAEGLVYDNFEAETHACRPAWASSPARVIVGVDEGTSNPFAALRIVLDPDRRAHVIDEVYQTGMIEADKVEAVRRMAKGADRIVYDAAAASLGEALRRAGLPAVACRKGPDSVTNGCAKVRTRFGAGPDGAPRLTVDPACTNLLKEIDTYQWRRGRDGPVDQPIDQNNHALDALRYAIVDLDSAAEVTGGALVGSPAPAPLSFAEARRDPNFGFEDLV